MNGDVPRGHSDIGMKGSRSEDFAGCGERASSDARKYSGFHQDPSYASMNWIRFEGSPWRAIHLRRSMTSQPLAGTPLVRGRKVAAIRAQRQQVLSLSGFCVHE